MFKVYRDGIKTFSTRKDEELIHYLRTHCHEYSLSQIQRSINLAKSKGVRIFNFNGVQLKIEFEKEHEITSSFENAFRSVFYQ